MITKEEIEKVITELKLESEVMLMCVSGCDRKSGQIWRARSAGVEIAIDKLTELISKS